MTDWLIADRIKVLEVLFDVLGELRNAFRKNRDNVTCHSSSDRRGDDNTSARMRKSSRCPWRAADKPFNSCRPDIWRRGNHFRPPQILRYYHRCHCCRSCAIYFGLQLACYGIRWYAAVNKTNYKIGLLERVKNAFGKNFCNLTGHSRRNFCCAYCTSPRLRQSPCCPWRAADYLLIPFSLYSRHRGNHLRPP